MSLNRYERMLYDYWQDNPDELRFWQAKVRELSGGREPDPAMVMTLNAELWRYFEERAGVVQPFKGVIERKGSSRLSMLNLAEYLFRIWLPPRPAKKASSRQDSSLPH